MKKHLLLIIFLLFPITCFADALISKSGDKVEGETTVSMEKHAVVVLDFTVSGQENQNLNWIKRGAADQVQIEFQNRGFTTLDREAIRAVLNEQRLSESAFVDSEQRITTGKMVGADWLVYGTVAFAGTKFQMEVNVTTVSDSKTLATTSVTGSYPEEFMAAIPKAVSYLAGQLGQRTAIVQLNTADKYYRTSPEALMLFYKGVDACAKNWPEEGVAWFLAVEQLDPRFVPAKVWEYRAYQMAGFSEHAEIAKKELLSIDPDMRAVTTMSVNKSKGNKKKLIAVLSPLSGIDNGAGDNNSAVLKQILNQVILKDTRLRLFDASMLNEIAAENDLHLSGKFEQDSILEYIRWISVDGLVFSRIVPMKKGTYKISMSILNPLSGMVSAQKEQEVKDVSEDSLDSAVTGLVDTWLASPEIKQQPLPLEEIVQPLYNEQLQRESYYDRSKILALLLNKLRRGIAVAATRAQLADLYSNSKEGPEGFGHAQHALLELEQMQRDTASQTQLNEEEIYWAYYAYALTVLNSSLEQAQNEKREVVLKLAEKYPYSLPAGLIWYTQGRKAYGERNWFFVIFFLNKAMDAFKVELEPLKPQDMGSGPSIKSERYFMKNYQMATRYLLGESFMQIGKIEEARGCLLKAERLLAEMDDISQRSMPSGPGTIYTDTRTGEISIGGGGGDPFDFPVKIKEALGRSKADIPVGKSMNYEDAKGRALILRDQIQALNKGTVGERQKEEKKTLLSEMKENLLFYLHATRDLWKSNPIPDTSHLEFLFQPDMFPLQMLTNYPGMVTKLEFEQLVEELVEALRIRTGLAQENEKNIKNPKSYFEAIGRIVTIYRFAGMKDKIKEVYGRLLAEPFPQEIGFNALSALGESDESYNIDLTEYEKKLSILKQRFALNYDNLPYDITYQLAYRYHEANIPDKAIHYFREFLLKSGLSSFEQNALYSSAKYFIACDLIKENQDEEAAELLREIISKTSGQYLILRKYTRSWTENGLSLSQLASSLLEKLRETMSR